MISLIDLLKENSTSTYEYSCAMLYFHFPNMEQLHSQIQSEDIYTEEGDKTFGLEDEPHCTLLYGLHKEVTLDDVKEVLEPYQFGPCKIFNTSIFENKDYDVLKFDVQGEILNEINSDLKQFPFTSNFPNYHPHMTIGYLKPGIGKKYVKVLKDLTFQSVIPDYAVYSQGNGQKDKINIKLRKNKKFFVY